VKKGGKARKFSGLTKGRNFYGVWGRSHPEAEAILKIINYIPDVL